ncbi:MAG: 3',5'-nucleoside bisphosphate phosphatase [Burkholderiaceae bacterium]|nr:3',5'-nucleoside bisphosphate phosphatase [Burkholderiaceae bacterium]
MLNVDLHCHSTVSDGVLAPAALAARAKANGVDIWALTDHDEVDGIAEARTAAAAIGLAYVAGVEVSVTWAGSTVHIVGLQIDETNPALAKGLANTRNGRLERAHEIAAELAAVGVPDAFEGALKFAGNPDLLSRTHFARYIIQLGICSSVTEVFKKYLIEGKPGYVPHRWATLQNAVTWIREAGGIAVVAHPGRYKFSDLAFDEFIQEFKRQGGTAMEVTTGSHSVDQYDYYAGVASRYGLLASRGSDFHSPNESRADLGALPPLPAGLTPVWHDWALP